MVSGREHLHPHHGVLTLVVTDDVIVPLLAVAVRHLLAVDVAITLLVRMIGMKGIMIDTSGTMTAVTVIMTAVIVTMTAVIVIVPVIVPAALMTGTVMSRTTGSVAKMNVRGVKMNVKTRLMVKIERVS